VVGEYDRAGFVHDEDVDEGSGVRCGVAGEGLRHGSVAVEEDWEINARRRAEFLRRGGRAAGIVDSDERAGELAAALNLRKLSCLVGAVVAEVR
jgi:hypothetical protein